MSRIESHDEIVIDLRTLFAKDEFIFASSVKDVIELWQRKFGSQIDRIKHRSWRESSPDYNELHVVMKSELDKKQTKALERTLRELAKTVLARPGVVRTRRGKSQPLT